MVFDIQAFMESLKNGIAYIPATLLLVLVPYVSSIILGIFAALAMVKKVPVISQTLRFFITVYSGVPIVAALLVYQLLYLTQFNHIAGALHLQVRTTDVSMIWIGVFALCLQTFCMMTEAIRSGFLAVDAGQWEAGYAVGLTFWQTTVRIVIPQMFAAALPQIISLTIGLIKNSTTVVAVGITDIMVASTNIAIIKYTYLEAYIAAALIYWMIDIIVETGAGYIERHLKKYRGGVSV